MSERKFEKVLLFTGLTANQFTDQPTDRGTVTLFPDRIEFDGKKLKASLKNVRSVANEKGRLKVTYGEGTNLETSYLADVLTPAGKRRHRELREAAQSLYAAQPLSEEERKSLSSHEEIMRQAKAKTARRNMWIGAALAIGGVLLTIITYSAASSSSSGGRYFVAYGPAIFGTILFVGGLIEYKKNTR
ncbi:MAG: hypothetical protein WD757_07170 [Actinomycetota bacterium]